MKLLLILLLSLTYSAFSSAKFTERTGEDNPFDGINVDYHSTPTFVDIDNDGDFDALVGGEDGRIKYIKNTGTNSNPTFTEQTGSNNPLIGIYVGYHSAPTFVDIDNDGDFDAFVGREDGRIKYIKNTGTNSNPSFTEQTGSNNPLIGIDVGYHSAPTFVDIDNDGDFDAFIGSYFGDIHYYKNIGTNSNPSFTKQTGSNNPLIGIDVGYHSAPTFVDIDNDGDFDALVGGEDGRIKYIKNTGTNSNPTFTEQTGSNNPLIGIDVSDFSVPTFVDIDNDGDFDAFIGNLIGIDYFENTVERSPSFVTKTGNDNPFDGLNTRRNSNIDLSDIDNDGDLDAFVGEEDGRIYHYENTGTNSDPAFTEQTGGDNPFNGVDVDVNSTIDLVDIDNDGDLDAFVGERKGKIYYFKNTGNDSIPTFTEQTGSDNPFDSVDVGLNSTIDFIDIDNDGDLDAFIGEELGNINYFKNIGNDSIPTFTEQTGSDNPFDGVDEGSNSNVSFFDIDNDGDYDALFGEENGAINLYENTGNKRSPSFVERYGADNPFHNWDFGTNSAIELADIDNDGNADVFVGEKQSKINYIENLGFDPFSSQVEFINIASNSATFSSDLLTGFDSNTFTFELRKSSSDYSVTTSEQTISSSTTSVNVSSTIGNLEPNTKYYIRAKAKNSKTFRYSLGYAQYPLSFKTLVALPEAYSPTFSNIRANSASFTSDFYNGNDSGTLTFEIGSSMGNYSSTTSSTTFAASTSSSTSSSNTFGLLPNTKYFVRARAENSRGFSYSPSSSFTTLIDKPIAFPMIIRNIGTTHADLVSDFYNGNGSSTLTFEIGTSSSSLSNSFTSRTFGGILDTLSSTLMSNKLSPNTKYFVRARIENSRTFSYSSSSTFRTLADAPPIAAANNITVYLDENGSASFSIEDIDNGSSDDLSGFSLSVSDSIMDCSDLGKNSITLTITDISDQSSSAISKVTVLDTLAPVISARNRTVWLDNELKGELKIGQIETGSTDNCTIETKTLSKTNFTCEDAGTNWIDYVVTDISGNSSTVTLKIKVREKVNPEIAYHAELTRYLDEDGRLEVDPFEFDNGSTDNCGIVSYHLSKKKFSCKNADSTFVLKYTVKDASGRKASANVTLHVKDSIAPTILTKDYTVQLNKFGTKTIKWQNIDNKSFDNCKIESRILSKSEFNGDDLGINTITYTLTDNNGLVSSKEISLLVEDNIKPTLRTKRTTVYLDENGEATLNASDLDNGSYDNVEIASLNLSKTFFNSDSKSKEFVVFTATDIAGNSNSRTLSITVKDTIKPVISGLPTGDITVNTSEDAATKWEVVTWDEITASDNVALKSFTSNYESGDEFKIGTTKVTYTAIDSSKNKVKRSFNVIVKDITPPKLTLSVNKDELISNDHKLENIRVTTKITDNSQTKTTLELVSITSSEDDSGIDSTDVADDIQGESIGTADKKFSLRDESFESRVYTIKYSATDKFGNISYEEISISVTGANSKISINDNSLEQRQLIGFNAYPNPMQSFININYQLVEDSQINLFVIDATGRRIAELLNKYQLKGEYSTSWTINSSQESRLSTGIYYLVLQTEMGFESIPIHLVK